LLRFPRGFRSTAFPQKGDDDMPMILLSKGAEILLVQFHEQKGDRVGASVGDRLPERVFKKAEGESPGVDFEGAMESLLEGNLVRKEGEEYVLTQEGYDYLYKRTGHRVGEG
jgi:hypothetical protein